MSERQPFVTWDHNTMAYRHHRSFAAAEKWARKHVVDKGGEIGICHRDGTTVAAWVRVDALGRVWTDVVDCEVA